MSFKSRPLPADADERAHFHAIFCDWLNAASEEDYQQLDQARDAFAPNQVCPAVNLVLGCLARPQLEQQLPQSLRQLLIDRRWPPACVDATAP